MIKYAYLVCDMSFDEIWSRITSETDLKTLTDLADLVGTTQPHISRKKKRNEFSADWAVEISLKYGLRIDWILTGIAPKDVAVQTVEYKLEVLKDLDEWLTQLVVKEPYRREWFRASIEDAFPMFKEWMKRKRAEDGKNTTTPANNVA